MSTHEPTSHHRICDVAVIGGSAAGLAAALQLGRQLRRVIVIDAGAPRNAPAAHMHSYLGHEGLPPTELTAIGREEVRSYGGEVLTAVAAAVTRTPDGRFRVELEGGYSVVARRVVAATGLVDVLPNIEGLAAHWGGDVIHCPFCHGYEVRDRRIVQIVTNSAALHPTALFRQLTDRLIVVLHEGVDEVDPAVERLKSAGVAVVAGPVGRIVDDDDGRLAAVELVDGRRIDADAVAIGPRFAVRAEPFASLGLRTTEHATGLGDFIETDETGQTTVPGLFAAGNLTDPSQQVLQAAAAGARVGAMVSFSLADEDVETAGRPSPTVAEWDHRYSGDRMWSGNPNGSLVTEEEAMTPGRALDIGAGEGGDAVWLAERGWKVTASDISARALDQIAAVADERGLPIECTVADAAGPAPFEPGAFDLVSAQYVPIPRSPDDRGIHNLLDAVAVGGTLVVVSHDPDAMRSPGAGHGSSGHGAFRDPDAMVLVDHIAKVVRDAPEWNVEVHEKRPRPEGHGSIHVDDVVLRARRLR